MVEILSEKERVREMSNPKVETVIGLPRNRYKIRTHTLPNQSKWFISFYSPAAACHSQVNLFKIQITVGARFRKIFQIIRDYCTSFLVHNIIFEFIIFSSAFALCPLPTEVSPSHYPTGWTRKGDLQLSNDGSIWDHLNRKKCFISAYDYFECPGGTSIAVRFYYLVYQLKISLIIDLQQFEASPSKTFTVDDVLKFRCDTASKKCVFVFFSNQSKFVVFEMDHPYEQLWGTAIRKCFKIINHSIAFFQLTCGVAGTNAKCEQFTYFQAHILNNNNDEQQ